jgi:hypothetical protein
MIPSSNRRTTPQRGSEVRIMNENFEMHTIDSEAEYRAALSKSEQFKRAAEVGEFAPDPVQGGPHTPGHAAAGH